MPGALDVVVAEVLTGRTHHGLLPATPEPAAVRRHADVAEAVQAGDADGARRATQAIIAEASDAPSSARHQHGMEPVEAQ